MKKTLPLYPALLALLLLLTACVPEAAKDAKPVLYLYPEEETDVTVRLDFSGTLTASWPVYKDGWQVRALPDGTLYDQDGEAYYCLFWEGISHREYDFSQGFSVAGEDTGAFLRQVLSEMGLTDREYNEFILYWLPRMEGNPYNLIAFQGENYTDSAQLTIRPAPDSLLRVFMAYKPLEEPVELPPQTFSPFVRQGFTAVEWGGVEVR